MIVNTTQTFFQDNTGDNQGTVWATKNIDPELNRGKLNVSKVLAFGSNTDDQANLGEVASGFAFFNSTSDKYYAAADDRAWESSGTDPDSNWSEVGRKVADDWQADFSKDTDVIQFFTTVSPAGNKLIFATKNNLRKYIQADDEWTNIDSLNDDPHSMCIYANRLYVSDLSEKVYSMTAGEVVSKSGANTIDLNSVGGINQEITKIAPVSDGIWIATTYSDNAGGEMIKWDGVTANTATARYKLPRGALAMAIKDDRPYVMDSLGRLRVFDGTTFAEIARLPVDDEELFQFNNKDNERWIHPNGMVTYNDEIYMLLNNTNYDSTRNVPERLPAGVWAWNKRNGLYHKYSFVDGNNNSTFTPTDYGASNLAQTGALFIADATGGTVISKNDNTEILAGIKYYSDATTTKAAIGIIDTDNDIKKAGYFVTAQIPAEQAAEMWQSVVATYDKMKNTTDKIIIKYRTSEDTPIYGTGTWTSDDILRSVTDLSSVSNGDEIEILQGKGAGLCANISSITGTYRMTLDETISGMSGTCKFRAQKWKRIGDIADTTSTFKNFNFGSNASAWIQFKVFMIGTGKSPQLNKLVSVSKVHENY